MKVRRCESMKVGRCCLIALGWWVSGLMAKEREKWRMLFFQMGSCNSEKVEGFVNVNVNVNVSVKS